MSKYLYNTETGITCPLFREHYEHGLKSDERVISARLADAYHRQIVKKEEIDKCFRANRDPDVLLTEKNVTSNIPLDKAQKYAPPKIEESEDEVDAVVEPEPFFPKPLEQMGLKELTNMAEQYGITKETYPDLKFNKASLISILNEVSENGLPIPDGPSEVL